MRVITIALLVLTATAFGQTGRITGTVVDDAGTPIQGASVAAALWSSTQAVPLVPGRPPAFMPVPATALSGSRGEFEVDGLLAGQYYICVEKPDAAVLNPCLWADPPPPVNVASGATVTGVSVVAARGVTLSVRVQDAHGLLLANPARDDVRVGIFHRTSPFIPGRISGRDPAGRTVSVIVPRGQAASISVSSSAFALADAKGASLANTVIQVPSNVVASGSTAPVATVYVTGANPGHP